jgi:hypothetical protein
MNILVYSRPKDKEPVAEQTITLLTEQLQHLGLHVEITHSLNIPRLILNSYQAVHLVIEELPLTVNEALHLGVCKALGKATVVTILNSHHHISRAFLNFVKPDALSVSQTNHLKYYRDFTCNKFVLSAFPKAATTYKKTAFKNEGFLVPIQEKLEEATSFSFSAEAPVYFDGRKLLKKKSSLQLRKKWNDLVVAGKLGNNCHLLLSESKLNEILSRESLAVLLADPALSHSEFTQWLGKVMNRANLVLLNEFQATGFSAHWTSGQNCIVTSADGWQNVTSEETASAALTSSGFKPLELFEPSVNELSRLYSKLLHQKASLLTSGSVKL